MILSAMFIYNTIENTNECNTTKIIEQISKLKKTNHKGLLATIKEEIITKCNKAEGVQLDKSFMMSYINHRMIKKSIKINLDFVASLSDFFGILRRALSKSTADAIIKRMEESHKDIKELHNAIAKSQPISSFTISKCNFVKLFYMGFEKYVNNWIKEAYDFIDARTDSVMVSKETLAAAEEWLREKGFVVNGCMLDAMPMLDGMCGLFGLVSGQCVPEYCLNMKPLIEFESITEKSDV